MGMIRHFLTTEESGLVEAMIRKLGLCETMRRLPDRRAVLARAVARCAGCAQPDACRHWLAGADVADEAPSYCTNHDLFERLLDRPGRQGQADADGGICHAS